MKRHISFLSNHSQSAASPTNAVKIIINKLARILLTAFAVIVDATIIKLDRAADCEWLLLQRPQLARYRANDARAQSRYMTPPSSRKCGW